MDQKWSVEELAASSFKLFHAVMGDGCDWEKAALERQAPWLSVAKQSEGVLRSMDGCSYAHCGRELMRLMMQPEERTGALAMWNNMPERAKIAWEAVARHLWTLHDCDDPAGLEHREAFWARWAEEASKKREKQTA